MEKKTRRERWRELMLQDLGNRCPAHHKEENLLEDREDGVRIFEVGTGWIPSPRSG